MLLLLGLWGIAMVFEWKKGRVAGVAFREYDSESESWMRRYCPKPALGLEQVNRNWWVGPTIVCEVVSGGMDLLEEILSVDTRGRELEDSVLGVWSTIEGLGYKRSVYNCKTHEFRELVWLSRKDRKEKHPKILRTQE